LRSFPTRRSSDLAAANARPRPAHGRGVARARLQRRRDRRSARPRDCIGAKIMLDQPLATSKMIAEKDGPIGRLIFNNPARHNAVSLEMWQAVTQIMDDFEEDDRVRVIVVSGAGGRAFVSGADISEFKERRASEEAAAAYAKISEGARMRLQETLKPTIAMIRGYCIGGGVGQRSPATCASPPRARNLVFPRPS